jgi:hypothetical protein
MEARRKAPPLYAWNPMDHLRLLWWVLVAPQELKIYRKTFGKKEEVRVGNCLVSTLTWLPLFILTLALGLGTLPHIEDTPLPSAAYLGISLGLAMTWVLTGWLAKWLGKMTSERAFFLGFYVATSAFVVVAAVVTGVVALGVTFDIAGFGAIGLVFAMTLSVALGVAIGLALEAAMLVFGAASGVMLGTMLTLLNTEGNARAGTAKFAVFFVIAIIASVSAAGMAPRWVLGVEGGVEKSLKTGHSFWLAQGAFGALVLAYAFLVWFSFLGGWRWFQ